MVEDHLLVWMVPNPDPVIGEYDGTPNQGHEPGRYYGWLTSILRSKDEDQLLDLKYLTEAARSQGYYVSLYAALWAWSEHSDDIHASWLQVYRDPTPDMLRSHWDAMARYLVERDLRTIDV